MINQFIVKWREDNIFIVNKKFNSKFSLFKDKKHI